MTKISDLREIDDFQIYKRFIKQFILQDESLFRLIYFCNKNVFDEEKCPYPENPFKIFTNIQENENDNHGVVLFRQKNNEILNYGTVIVLVDFNTAKLGNSGMLDELYIIFRIIIKSDDIQELEDENGNTVNRLYAIAELINNHLNHARINSIGNIEKQSMHPLSINEENCGITLIMKTQTLSNRLLEEANK